jgi:hypothetical protein
MKLFRRIKPGEARPRYMGMVRIDCLKDEAVCAPIPLSTICRLIYLLWQWLGHSFFNSEGELVKYGRDQERKKIEEHLKRCGVIIYPNGTVRVRYGNKGELTVSPCHGTTYQFDK